MWKAVGVRSALAITLVMAACGGRSENDTENEASGTGGTGGAGAGSGDSSSAGGGQAPVAGRGGASPGTAGQPSEGGMTGDSGAGGGEDPGHPGDENGCHGSYGTLGALSGDVMHEYFDPKLGVSDDGRLIRWLGKVDGALGERRLRVTLRSGMGAFAGGAITTGTFEIAGEERDPRTCGVCVSMAEGGLPYFDIAARGGTVTVSSIEGELAVTLSNITFVPTSEGDDIYFRDDCPQELVSASLGGELPPAGCVVASDYETLGNLPAYASERSTRASIDRWVEISTNLRDSYGVFATGIAEGTYELTGAELASNTCGLCVTLVGDADDGDLFLLRPTGGTVTIDSLESDMFGIISYKVSVSDLEFEHPELDCSTSIESARLDWELTDSE